jgi:hypothetical protein
MSFLFKSKKSQNPNALPNATRGIHTSEGTSSPPANVPINGFRDRDRDPEKLPGIVPGSPMAAPPGSPRLRRDRADSEPQVGLIRSSVLSRPVCGFAVGTYDLRGIASKQHVYLIRSSEVRFQRH